MVALLILGLFILTALCLVAALVYLYRWIVRKKLFPQLPRLWTGDKKRFVFSFLGFVLSLIAFIGLSLYTGPGHPAAQEKAPRQKPLRPMFDGKPPPDLAAIQREKARRRAQEQALNTTTTSAPPTTTTAAPVTTTSAPTTTTAAPVTTTTTTTTAAPTTTTTTAPPPPKKKPAPAQAKPKVKSKAPAGKAYTVCAASFRQDKAARAWAAQLAKKGLKPRVVAVELPGKGRWYRVCLGRFATPAQAAARARALKKQGLAQSPFPTRLR